MGVTFDPPKRKPNFAARMKKPHPANMIRNWPPVVYRGFSDKLVKHREVKPGPLDTFWDLAAKVDRHSNPWDIILYNFETEDPLEVNWYLHHAVGCWKSYDGANFNFASADPGKLYLPEDKKWKPPEWFAKGSGANRFVNGQISTAVSLLEKAAVDFPTVEYGDTRVSAGNLRKVGELLDSHRITLSIEPGNMTFEGRLGQYVFDSRTIRLSKPPSINDTEMMGVLCNEATHVISHYNSKTVWEGAHEMTSTIVESIAVAKADPRFAEKWYMADPLGEGAVYAVGLVVLRHFAGARWIDVQNDLVGKKFPEPALILDDPEFDPMDRLYKWHKKTYPNWNAIWNRKRKHSWDSIR
jgi:hypothetical protein